MNGYGSGSGPCSMLARHGTYIDTESKQLIKWVYVKRRHTIRAPRLNEWTAHTEIHTSLLAGHRVRIVNKGICPKANTPIGYWDF